MFMKGAIGMLQQKFSIITVCYNSEKTIERTIKSVLNQTIDDYEYIIVDGGSTDNTISLIDNYRMIFGKKLRVISEPDDGIYDAMNKGIRMSSGELVGIVNSDDYLEPDALKKISNVYDGYDYEIIYGMLRTISNGKEIQVYIKNHENIDADMIAHPSCFVTKKIYDSFGLYNLKYKYSADYEFMLRMIRNDKVKFVKLYEIISNFNLDGSSASVEAYMETMKLRHEYGFIDDKLYNRIMIKSKIKLFLQKQIMKE